MSFDERFLDGPPVPDRGREWRALAELRWLDGKLQQAWAPFYGGRIEWRNVPVVSAAQIAVIAGDTEGGA